MFRLEKLRELERKEISVQLILWIDLREGIPADEVLAVVETTYVNEQKLKLMSSLITWLVFSKSYCIAQMRWPLWDEAVFISSYIISCTTPAFSTFLRFDLSFPSYVHLVKLFIYLGLGTYIKIWFVDRHWHLEKHHQTRKTSAMNKGLRNYSYLMKKMDGWCKALPWICCELYTALLVWGRLCGEGAEVGTNNLKQEEVGWATEALSALE